jgi:hypothetical protein
MSTLSVNSAGQDPYQQVIQSIAAQRSTSGQQSPGSAATAGVDPTQLGSRPHHHRRHGGGGSGGGVSNLLDEITKALQQTSDSSDPNQVIEDTVAKLIAKDGGCTGATGTAANNLANGSTEVATNQPSGQSLTQVLKAHGVDIQQFRADLAAAIKDASSGKVNPATALKSFPPGSALDTSA